MVKLVTTFKKHEFHSPTTCNRNPNIIEAQKICTFSSHEKQVKIWLVLASIDLPSSLRLLSPFLFLSSQFCCISLHTSSPHSWKWQVYLVIVSTFWMLPFFSPCCDPIRRKCLLLYQFTILGDHFFFVAENHNSCRGRHGNRNRGPAELKNRNSGWATNPQALIPVIYLLQRISWGFYSLPKQHQQLEMKCLNTRAEGGQVTFKQHHQVLLSDAEEKDEKLGGHEEEKNPFTLNSNCHLCQKQSKDFSTMNNLGDPS